MGSCPYATPLKATLKRLATIRRNPAFVMSSRTKVKQQDARDFSRTVLQRIDPDVEEILTSASHVSLYEFNLELSQWSRKDVEGSLFVVKRKSQPRFQFIIINRRSTENLVQDLLSGFEYSLQPPYLLYRNAAQEVNGLFFHNPGECDEVVKYFSRIIHAFLKVPTKGKLLPAESEFHELDTPNAALTEGILEPFATRAIAKVPSTPASISGPVDSVPVLSSITSNVCSSHIPNSPLLDGLEVSQPSQNNFIKPSFVAPHSFASAPMPPPPVSSTPPQPSHGAPFLQPFPPPTPSLSLAPPAGTSSRPLITKTNIQSALSRLIQNEQFIDMIYKEICNSLPT